MDGFIGPIQKPIGVSPTAKGAKKDDQSKEFTLLSGESEEPENEPAAEDHHLDDLPVGPPRFDETGQRIDYTA
ncbi:MAG: hypothetical protein P1V35_14690 [Planctomycetota bacterium]|nr:hypothetical protein [Planctomycetota bacterium]